MKGFGKLLLLSVCLAASSTLAADLSKASAVPLGERLAAYLTNDWAILQRTVEGRLSDVIFIYENKKAMVTIIGEKGDGKNAQERVEFILKFLMKTNRPEMEKRFGVDLVEANFGFCYYDPDQDGYLIYKGGEMVKP